LQLLALSPDESQDMLARKAQKLMSP